MIISYVSVALQNIRESIAFVCFFNPNWLSQWCWNIGKHLPEHVPKNTSKKFGKHCLTCLCHRVSQILSLLQIRLCVVHVQCACVWVRVCVSEPVCWRKDDILDKVAKEVSLRWQLSKASKEVSGWIISQMEEKHSEQRVQKRPGVRVNEREAFKIRLKQGSVFHFHCKDYLVF